MSRDADLLPNPCHLLDTAWQGLDADDGYDSIQADMTVEVDPGESASYYYSNTVYFPRHHVDASGALHGAAYAGIQTNGHSGVDDRHVGKMAIFSAWDGMTGEAEPGGWGSRFAENGTGYSVRVPFAWEEGVTSEVLQRHCGRRRGTGSKLASHQRAADPAPPPSCLVSGSHRRSPQRRRPSPAIASQRGIRTHRTIDGATPNCMKTALATPAESGLFLRRDDRSVSCAG